MYKLWQFLDRANTGPFCEVDDFNKKLFMPKMKEVIKKYGIKYDPDQPVNVDDDLADRVWQAAVELFLYVGVLNVDTHRRIIIEEHELKEALYHAPEFYLVGEGKDIRNWKPRLPESTDTPFCIYSGDITCDENIFLPMAIAYCQEPLADGVCASILEESMGLKIKAGSPVELAGVTEHAMQLRQAAKLCGRPGMFHVAVGTALSAMAQVAVSNNEWGVRDTDARLVAGLSELNLENDAMNKIAHCMNHGSFIGNLTGSIYGGYAGRAEGVAILETAYHLMGLTIYQANFQQSFPFHLHFTSNTGREMLWLVGIKHQAVSRNSRILSTSNGFTNAGPGTEMVLYEAAAHGLTSTVSGGHLWETAVARNKTKNYASPIEARMACEVGHSVAKQGMSRVQANEIVDRLLKKYEDNIADAPMGVPFQECYNVDTAQPEAWWEDMFGKIKNEVAEMGVDFVY